jgi:hypothetical protein
MELVPKETTTPIEPTLAEQVDKLLRQQSSIEKIFNSISKDLFGTGPYHHGDVETMNDLSISSKLQILIGRYEEFTSYLVALGNGVKGDHE